MDKTISMLDLHESFSFKKDFDERIKKLKTATSDAGKHLSNMFKFCESVFTDGQEMVIIVTELTINPNSAAFISKYGCVEYFKHNNELLIYDRQKKIILLWKKFLYLMACPLLNIKHLRGVLN